MVDQTEVSFQEQASPVKSGQRRILILDDDQSITRMLCRMLNRMGYEVVSTADGTETIDTFRQAINRGDPFDLVILDLTIPGGMGGAKVMPELIKLDPEVKAIVSSGYSNDPIMANYSEYGFCGIAPKPYTRQQLTELLGRVLNDRE